MRRVQFAVTEVQYNELMKVAKSLGYPDVVTYCRDVVLNGDAYQKLWTVVCGRIATLTKGTEFFLRDIIPSPPTGLGRRLYEHQEELGIRVFPKKIGGTNKYFKL